MACRDLRHVEVVDLAGRVQDDLRWEFERAFDLYEGLKMRALVLGVADDVCVWWR